MTPDSEPSRPAPWPALSVVRVPERTGDGADVWLAGIRDGDEEAFNRFYDLFATRLYRYLVAILPSDEALVRDAFQETMVRVVRYAKPVPTEADAWRWLTRVGRNALYDLLRKRRRRRDREAAAPALRLEPEAAVARLEGALDSAVRDLPAEDRSLIHAVYYERIDQTSLAGRMGITRKAVESRLARLRIRLRARVAEALTHDD